MPESFAALAVDVTPVQEPCPETPKGSRPAAKAGRLRETFESMKDADLGGVKVSFSASNHQGLSSGFLNRIEDGKVLPVTR